MNLEVMTVVIQINIDLVGENIDGLRIKQVYLQSTFTMVAVPCFCFAESTSFAESGCSIFGAAVCVAEAQCVDDDTVVADVTWGPSAITGFRCVCPEGASGDGRRTNGTGCRYRTL
jgi:hypothetical protein